MRRKWKERTRNGRVQSQKVRSFNHIKARLYDFFFFFPFFFFFSAFFFVHIYISWSNVQNASDSSSQTAPTPWLPREPWCSSGQVHIFGIPCDLREGNAGVQTCPVKDKDLWHEFPFLFSFSLFSWFCLAQDRNVHLWNATKGTLIKTYGGHSYEVCDLAFGADNNSIASCGGDKVLTLF